MKFAKLFSLLIIITSLFACNKDDDATEEPIALTINFTHHWDGTAISNTDFDNIQYTNANGEELSITKLRYLISKITLHAEDGTSTVLEGYALVDVTEGTNLSFTTTTQILDKTYTSISYNFGFDTTDNAENYIDLNAASWNWPTMLGGGYHYMQLEGYYTNATMPNTNTYAYHMGVAMNDLGVAIDNHFETTLSLNNQTFTDTSTLEVKMNLSEWFKNPNQWDLNVYNNALMGNYDAQITMHQNSENVFSLGTVTP